MAKAGDGEMRFVDAASLRSAERKLDRARMTGAGVQPQTIAGRDVEVIVTEHVATKGDGKGGRGVERFEVRALFDRAANPILRLTHEGLVTSAGALAAFTFAAAGDRVLGAVRVRTVSFERDRIVGGEAVANADKDVIARKRWDEGRAVLSRAEFAIIDGVMRHDQSARDAARAVYPTIKARDKLIGMGDQALIEACAKLADAFGFEARAAANRTLAGL